MLLALTACDPVPAMPDAACVRMLPACPSPAPSYASTVGPLVHDHCVPCHFAGSTIAPFDLSTYADVHARQGTVLGQLYVCAMPPASAPAPLADADRLTILSWLACGAPDN